MKIVFEGTSEGDICIWKTSSIRNGGMVGDTLLCVLCAISQEDLQQTPLYSFSSSLKSVSFLLVLNER
jgi:hypothetical protein